MSDITQQLWVDVLYGHVYKCQDVCVLLEVNEMVFVVEVTNVYQRYQRQ